MAEKVDSIPAADGPYKYQSRTVENAEHPIHVRTDLNGEHEEVIFDVNAEARSSDYFDFGGLSHSPDHSKLLWSCDTSGAEFHTLHIRDIATGLDKDYVIENTDDVTWGDDQTIFYTRVNSSRRILQVYKHVLDSDPEHDVLVFNEVDERFHCSVYMSHSQDFIFIRTSTWNQDEFWFIPANDLNAPPTLVQARMEGLEYDVEGHQGDRFIISTNADGATEWKLVESPVNATSMEHWTDLVPHQAGQRIAGVVVFQDWIVWLEVVNALGQIAYMDKNGSINRVKLEEEAYALGLIGHEFHTQSFKFQYSSPTTQWETYEFDLQTAERVLLKQQIIPSGHDPKEYVTRRFTVESHDGAQVPVTLLYRHDTPNDGSAPALLYGYGSYGSSSMNMKPELFAGVIAEAPDVDVLNLMLDDTLPGIPDHWPEWGNPIVSKAAFNSIRSYSPYENIEAVGYPALYVSAGASDPRVVYWQPAKWVAKLRSLKTDNNIVLFRTNMQSGHFGQTGRFARIDDTARMYAFAISVTTDQAHV